MEDNVIKVSVRPNKQNSVKVSSNVVSTPITANSDTSQIWSQVSKNWAVSEKIVDNTDYSSKYYANKAKESASNAQGFESAIRDVYNGFLGETTEAIENVQGARDEAIANIETSRVEAVDSINSTKTTILSDIEFVADGEKKEINDLADEIKDNADTIINRVGFNMFDTILKDHILTYEESKGLALQGTYVYKTAIAGERFGYPDFYSKCLEEYNEATSTETVNGVTVKVHSNGHKFYNIADKTAIDGFFNAMGSAWFYGVDTANERIFLPRNNYFEQATGDTSKVGDSVEAGLPNITGEVRNISFDDYGTDNVTGAFNSITNVSNATGGSSSNEKHCNITFNASASNSIYGNSNTVQPNAVKKLLYICVGNTVSNTSWVDVVTQVEGGVKDLEDKTLEGIERLRQSSTALTQTQITNCLLEVPQRIKYTLENGTLTIKAGTVVIVPYGTEDLTAQYPKGATFLHENFKVYDTQFADGKFFVWAELISDMECVGTTSTNEYTAGGYIDLINNSFRANANLSVSGTDASVAKQNAWFYDTDDNRVGFWATSSNNYARVNCSFPVLITTSIKDTGFLRVDKVFNGMGYIGSTVWVDKGVKGLIPNGRNEDGSLNNIEIINQTLDTYTYTWGSRGFSIFLTESGGINWCGVNDLYRVETFSNLPTVSSGSIGYVDNDNQWYIATKGSNFVWEQFTALNIIKAVANNSIITSFNQKQPFRAVDYSEIAGLKTYIVETYQNGTSWYRIWSDGWCEQGGVVSANTTTVSLLKAMSNDNYPVLFSYKKSTSTADVTVKFIATNTQSTTSFTVTSSTIERNWEAKGYIA